MLRQNGIRCVALATLACLLCAAADAARVKDLCEVQGARGNMLKGIGLVAGLAGTGDKVKAALVAPEIGRAHV